MRTELLFDTVRENDTYVDVVPVNGRVRAISANDFSGLRSNSNRENPLEPVKKWTFVAPNRASRRAERSAFRREFLEVDSTSVPTAPKGVFTKDAPQNFKVIQSLIDPGIRDFLKSSQHGIVSSWKSIREAIAEWRDLKDGWDGEDAPALSQHVIEIVISFVAHAEFSGIREPRAYVASDGEIGFHWDGVAKASVSFLPTDRFLAFCPRDGKSDVRISGPLDLATCSLSLFEALRYHS